MRSVSSLPEFLSGTVEANFGTRSGKSLVIFFVLAQGELVTEVSLRPVLPLILDPNPTKPTSIVHLAEFEYCVALLVGRPTRRGRCRR
jgi:hypothetical protein